MERADRRGRSVLFQFIAEFGPHLRAGERCHPPSDGLLTDTAHGLSCRLRDGRGYGLG
jgi:hypothetical protein